ncbi:MAG: Holliday junction endonuclease [Microbispora sp.]|nr:Holliday junction endonuclease [Microbispora sp.]
MIGLDLSLTATGIADFTHGEAITTTIRSKPHGSGTLDTHARLTAILREVFGYVFDQGPPPALIVLEGPSYGSKGNALHQLAGLWWLAVDQLATSQQPLAVVPPSTLKQYATGRGNASKTDMAVALAKRAGHELRDDNQVDAWWLGAAGRDHLGHPPVDLPKTHRAALDKVTWPHIPEVKYGA